MIYRTLGKNMGEIPAIGLGTWEIGGRDLPDLSRDKEHIDTISRAIEMGYTHIDTAEYYGGGHTEEIIGEAISVFSREELFITSKVWPTHLRKEELHRALEGTLRRLRTDYLDLYLIHWPNPDVPLEETLNAMSEEVVNGRVKFIGVSNFDTPLLKKAVAVSKQPIVNNQVLFNIDDRQPMEELLPYCQSHEITLTAYSPLKRNSLKPSTEKLLKDFAVKYSATVQQIMLAWLLGKEGVVVIPKASKLDHLRLNLEAGSIVLDDDDTRRLDSLE
ncbi:MAG TPA: aldo/keto reductase [Mesotoga prima]|jgi:diketogulonate reductase-like aldo/keto reductase|uniref:aldo/keto reductase n=1 Tax=Mesotoga prima TaxID=1184387 RepID=UPI002C565C7C|nr:aldo/keto reductase [Mesotoga prima]HPQ91483.1 aldo/keto reductase [Mesotoga prima]